MKQNKALLVKSVIYRPYSEVVTFLIAWAITGQLRVSIAIGVANLLMKIFSYYIFDLFWNKFMAVSYSPCVIWLTGLSGAGKTTIAKKLLTVLKDKNAKCILLDGDEIRTVFPTIGFDRESRVKHNVNVGYMASLLESQGFIVVVSLVSPFAEGRDKSRAMAKKFIEVYVSTPLDVCILRDTKGLYKKAISNEIADFTGISSPYENPVNPDLDLNTNEVSLNDSVKKIISKI